MGGNNVSSANCGSALTAIVQSPIVIDYTLGGSIETIINGYNNLFTHTSQAACPMSSCRILKVGCVDTFTGTEVFMTTNTPWSIRA